MGVHLIGAGARGLFDIASQCKFDVVLHLSPLAMAETPAVALVPCPRRGLVSAVDCLACPHLGAWQVDEGDGIDCHAGDGDLVSEWMRRPPAATTVETHCRAADAFAVARRTHHLLVFDRRLVLVGVVCRCDLGRGDDEAVARVMSTEMFAVAPFTTIGVAATVMKSLRVGCLPVVSDLFVLGMLTRAELVRAGVPEGCR